MSTENHSEDMSMDLRLALLEERLREGFRAMNDKLDTILKGETVNCTTHKSRMDNLEKKLDAKADSRIVNALWSVNTVVGLAILAALVKYLFFK